MMSTSLYINLHIFNILSCLIHLPWSYKQNDKIEVIVSLVVDDKPKFPPIEVNCFCSVVTTQHDYGANVTFIDSAFAFELERSSSIPRLFIV